MIALKLQETNGTFSVELPLEAVEMLRAKTGDTLYLAPTPDGAVRLSTHTPQVARQIAIGEALMDDFDEAFRELAR